MTIPVFFTLNKWYALASEVAFYSLLKNGSPAHHYALYVLSTDFPASSKKRLERIVGKFPNASIEFRDISAFAEKYKLPEGKSHFSSEIFYKLIAADIFPEYDRILCSDVDVIFEDDIAPALLDFPDEDFYFAGTTWFLQLNKADKGGADSNKTGSQGEGGNKPSYGLRAGFLLLNLSNIRQTDIQQTMADFYLSHYEHLAFPEQETITICCYPHIRYLHWKYCVLNYYYSMDKSKLTFMPESPYREFCGDRETALSAFTAVTEHPVQLHYVGPNKPWNRLFVDRQAAWLRYAFQAGALMQFVIEFPRQFGKTLGRYSLRRWLDKHRRRK